MRLLSFLLFSLLYQFSSAQTGGKNYALFFANRDYNSHPTFESLTNPIKDARAIERELEEMYGFESYIYEDKDRRFILATLQQWLNRRFGKNDQLFIFFSGHGTFDELTSTGYFVPRSKRDDVAAYIDLTQLGRIVTKINCRHILLAVDACYSGTIDERIALKGRSFNRPNRTQETERNNIIYRQLRNKSRLLLTSGGKQRTPDGTNHSPFAQAFLNKLRSAYTSGDGLCTYQDLLSQLERVTPTPHQGTLSGHEQGGFVFVAKGVNPPSPKPDLDHMIFVQGGTFQMGSKEGGSDETPHSVTLSDYYIARHEVTFEEYDRFCQATAKKKPDDEG